MNPVLITILGILIGLAVGYNCAKSNDVHIVAEELYSVRDDGRKWLTASVIAAMSGITPDQASKWLKKKFGY